MNESIIRVSFYVAGLLVFAGASLLFPFRKEKQPLGWKRWSQNLLLSFLNSIVLKIIFTTSLVQIAYQKKHSEDLLSAIGTIIILDFIVYWQHRLFHKLPFLWRLHRLHHADTEFDVTTGVRFHPIEIVLSYLIKMIAVYTLKLNPVGILFFEIILNLSALFTHANFSLPRWPDRLLRFIYVTPDMHRIHHSVKSQELNSNYGFFLAIWDRIFRSYKEHSIEDPRTMLIGLNQLRDSQEIRIDKMLTQPFRGTK